MPKIYNDIEQGSPEWHALRLGKLTASQAQAIGNFGKGLETLCYDKAAEILTGKSKEFIKTEAMEIGTSLENMARFRYEQETNCFVKEIGFAEHNQYVGCSPDGIVDGSRKLVEIKCPQDNTYMRYLVTGEVDTGYMWQMQMQMLIMGADETDYVVYNPNFPKDIVIQTIKASPEHFEKLKLGFEKGERLIKDFLEKAK